MLRDEAEMPLEDLLMKYEGMVGVPPPRILSKRRGVYDSPVIKAKKTAEKVPADQSDMADTNENAAGSSSAKISSKDVLANGHAENENNLNREKEENDSRQRSDSESQCSDNKTDVKNLSVQQPSVSSSDVVNTHTNPSVKKEDSSEADSSTPNETATPKTSKSDSAQIKTNSDDNSAQADSSSLIDSSTKCDDVSANLSSKSSSGHKVCSIILHFQRVTGV